MLLLFKAVLACGVSCYGAKNGYRKWPLFILAILLDPVAVFVIVLTLPNEIGINRLSARLLAATVSALCVGAFVFYLVIAGLAIQKPAVPDLTDTSCEWVNDGMNQYCYFEDVHGPSGQYGGPEMLKGLHKVGTEEYYFADSSHDFVLIKPNVPDGALVKDSEYLEILGEEGLIVAATIDDAGQVHKMVIPYVL